MFTKIISALIIFVMIAIVGCGSSNDIESSQVTGEANNKPNEEVAKELESKSSNSDEEVAKELESKSSNSDEEVAKELESKS